MKIAITAGPTREYLDPVRFFSNRSSGKMGYALARVMLEEGHDVHLISGPVSLDPVEGCQMTYIETSEEMLHAVMNILQNIDILIMVAAVSDYTVLKKEHKIKKESATLQLNLHRTHDILEEVSKVTHNAFVVGFSAESQSLLQNAQSKLIRKKMDMIVANDITSSDTGFDTDYNKGFLLFARDPTAQKELAKCSKLEFAQHICETIQNEMKSVKKG